MADEKPSWQSSNVFGGKKEKFQVFLFSLEKKNRVSTLLLPLTLFSFYFRENFPPHEGRTRKLNRFESVPSSLFSRKVSSTMPDMSKMNTFLAKSSLHHEYIARGMLFLNVPTLVSFRFVSFRAEIFPRRNKVYFLFSFFLFFYSLITSRSKCFLTGTENIFLEKTHLCLTQMLQPFGLQPIF